MFRMVILALLASSTLASAWDAVRNSRSFLGADMQPGVVAKTLSHVEEEWKTQARAFIECELSESKETTVKFCDETPPTFSKSCATVVSAVVQGSQGSPKVMKEYMSDVCKQDVMTNWHQSSCVALAQAIRMKMTASSYDNRVNFQTKPVCDDFWLQFLAEQKTLHEKELVAIREREKKAAEVAARQAKEAKEKAEKAAKEKEEAEKAADAKEAAEIEAERKMVALRAKVALSANRTMDRGMKQEEAEVEAVEEAAKKELDDATEVEQDVVLPAKEAAVENTTIEKDDVLPTKEVGVAQRDKDVVQSPKEVAPHPTKGTLAQPIEGNTHAAEVAQPSIVIATVAVPRSTKGEVAPAKAAEPQRVVQPAGKVVPQLAKQIAKPAEAKSKPSKKVPPQPVKVAARPIGRVEDAAKEITKKAILATKPPTKRVFATKAPAAVKA